MSDQDASQAQGEDLRARVWQRGDEWVLEIEGTIGDMFFNSRHTQPLSIAKHDVPGLPTHYAVPAPSATGQDGARVMHGCEACDGEDACTCRTPTPTIPAGMVAERWQTGRDIPKVEQRHKDAAAWAMDRSPDGLTWDNATASHVTPDRRWQMNRVAEAMARMERQMLAAAPKQAEQQGVERDAARWRALWNSDRIRMMGCAGFDFADDGSVTLRDDGWHHMGVEVWDKHPAKGDDSDSCGRKVLLAYVDSLAALNAPTGAVEKGEAK